MTTNDYWLTGILTLGCVLATWYKEPKARAGIRLLCLWIGAARLGFLTWQGYVHFVGSDAYRLNLGKQEEGWVMALVFCSAGGVLLVVAPLVWYYRAWRNERADFSGWGIGGLIACLWQRIIHE